MTTRTAPQAAAAAAAVAAAAAPRHPPANTDLIYHQTIIPTQKITHCVVGTFTLPGATDFVVVRHDTLELWTLHVDRNVAECIHSTRLFANIYQIATVPTIAAAGRSSAGHGGSGSAGILDTPSSDSVAMQRLAVTSETGCLVLLRYDLDEIPVPARLAQDPTSSNPKQDDNDEDEATRMRNTSMITSLRGKFVRVSEVVLGRSGARLTVPSARLAVDPLGRAVFVSALMRLKVLVPLRKHEEYYAQRGRRGSGGSLQEGAEEELLMLPPRGAEAGPEGTVMSTKRRPAIRDLMSFGSPVEAHRQTIIFFMCALDGATENATFATLEQEIPEAETLPSSADGSGNAAATSNVGAGQAFLRVNSSTRQTSHGKSGSSSSRSKQLVVYAFLAGLQQVQRTHLVSVPATAHRLIAVPAAPFGPGGVIVCTDAELIWYDLLPQLHGGGILGNSMSSSAPPLQTPLLSSGLSSVSLFKTAVPFPRRNDFREQLYDPMIISHAMTCVRNDFFMLLQDDQGDVFRISLTIMDVQRSYDALRMQQQQRRIGPPTGSVPPVSVPSPLTVTYFDTIPPTTVMVLFRRGFVFAASESSPTHGLYKIVKDGYRSDEEYILSRMRMVDQRHDSRRHEDGYDEETKGIILPTPLNSNPPSNPSAAAVTEEEEEEGTGLPRGGMMLPPSLPKAGGPAVLLPPPSSLPKTPQQQKGRVVPLFIPHPSLRHMVLLETYPSTPAITSFLVTIPQGEQDVETHQERQQQQQQQPHVQIDALVGRGSDSVLFHARYGYAARLESSFTLPAVFFHLIPLISATAMQQRWREMQMETKKTKNGGRYRSTAKNSSRLASSELWDDKLLLSTRQGTTVLSLALTGHVEPDTLSGFVTSEHTIAAGTLHYGVGYVQITPSCIVVLPYRTEQQQGAMGTRPMAESATWMHPHGKRILAAAVSGNTIVVSFAQGGGISSFDMGISGTRLQQLEAIPSFPHAPAISLLRDPDVESKQFNASLHPSLATSSVAMLAAIATASHEVYIVNPKKLREPLETIHGTADDNNGGIPPAIVSVLLTYLGRTGGVRRLFCFIGHIDGTVTRCELDAATYGVMDRAVLTCGSAPCQMIAGDGERACYVLCGEFNWRCDVRDGLPKTVPWRFPSPQVMYASFRRPPTFNASSTGSATTEVEMPTGAREELVLGVAGNTLSLFAAQQSGGTSTAETSLEYSFGHTPLSVAGRRLLQHPTRAEYLIVIGTEHRGYGVAALRRASAAAVAAAAEQQRRTQSNNMSNAADDAKNDTNNNKNSNMNSASSGVGIALDKPQRSLNHPDHYVSTLQLYNKRTDRLDPPLYFQEREAVLSAAVGSFVKDFGKEPVVVAGCAEQYTHGSGCGVGPSWTQGRLRAFRFVVSQPAAAGGGGSGTASTLRLEQLHDTLIAAAETSAEGLAGGTLAASYRAAPLLDYPSALHICPEVGLLFVGLGPENGLQVYAWGQRRFLRKRRLPKVPSRITAIETVFVSPPGAASATTATYAPDLFRCGPNSGNIAREKRLLIVCGTLDQSVFIATVQPGSGAGGSMSFLMLVARDAVPRSVTSVVCLDERTIAVADRFGSVAFLRLPQNARLGFAEPLHQMSDAELVEAERYAAHEQVLQEIAVHHTGQLVTALRVHDYDPSGGADPSLALRILFYATSLGTVGAYTPFVREEDAVFAAHLQPLVAAHIRCPLQEGSGHLPYNAAGRMTATAAAAVSPTPVHNVVEGDQAQLLLHASTSLFSTESKTEVEAELARQERVEAAQRKILGLPPRTWPVLAELVAKHRALVTLPP
ncbi:putative Mono-functional DNA-alkylating methyl methanesulfonate N-term/CPSF A subunit region [Trypanosoma cruzi]|nr:putative Mono-functional DNA-alkylating methyl methanesulfonate N-term/CPSF A subunit region [Trypanosoma cruzi]